MKGMGVREGGVGEVVSCSHARELAREHMLDRLYPGSLIVWPGVPSSLPGSSNRPLR